jgi:hypothetical protein
MLFTENAANSSLQMANGFQEPGPTS